MIGHDVTFDLPSIDHFVFKTIQRFVDFSMGEKLKYVTHCESLTITLENWSKLSPALSN